MSTMAQPMQDTDITSSLLPSSPLRNDDILGDSRDIPLSIIKGNKTDITSCLEWDNTRNILTNDRFKNENRKTEQMLEETFPWLIKFTKAIHSSVGSKSYQLLERLLLVYTQNILNNLDTYYVKTSDILKVKGHLSKTLTFFHFYWYDVKEYINDHNPYLNKMTILLGVYINMELEVSQQCNDPCKITATLLNALWIYLHNSEEHILGVLLRINITKKYTAICDPLFTKSFHNLAKRVELITDMSYVKYLLVLKLWKEIQWNSEEERKINEIAVTVLGPHMPKLRDDLLKFIPKPPAGNENETLWLLQSNVFDLKEACKHFLVLEEEILKTTESINCSMPQVNSAYIENNFQEKYEINNLLTEDNAMKTNKNNLLDKTINNKTICHINSEKKGFKANKICSVSKFKPDEIICIDLTEENDSTNTCDQKKKKKRSKKTLEWLKIIKKRTKLQKQVSEVKCTSKVEVVDTENTENLETTNNKDNLEHMPISVDKVSESIESCISCIKQKLISDIHEISSKDINTFGNKNEDYKCTVQHKLCNSCNSILKQNETQYGHIICVLKLLKLIRQNIKNPKVILSLIKRCREENLISQIKGNKTDKFPNITVHGKELSTLERNFIKTIILPEMCQNCIKNSTVRELPTNTDSTAHLSDKYSSNSTTNMCITDWTLNKAISNSTHNTQVVELSKQNLLHNCEKCTTCKKVDIKPFINSISQDSNTSEIKDTLDHTKYDSIADKKSVCDKEIVNMFGDLEKCMDVLNRTNEHIMSVHAEKQRVKEPVRTNMCTVSTTMCGDEITGSSLNCWIQDSNSLTPDKANKILELYGKKEFFNMCKIKEFCKSSTDEIPTTSIQMMHAAEKYKEQVMVSTAKMSESCSHESRDIHTMPLVNKAFNYTHVNTESSELFNYDNNMKNSDLTTEQVQKKNQYRTVITSTPQIHSIDSHVIQTMDSKNLMERRLAFKSSYKNSVHTKKDEFLVTNCVNEFDNVDILDSILNGDMNMEDERDIMEDPQTSMISPISHDNSATVLNYITEFITQSEETCVNKVEGDIYNTNTDTSMKALPEGSLGTTGILNSLLDFELTSMQYAPNDFMYLHVPTADPHLIKNNVNEEMYTMIKPGNNFELQSERQKYLSSVDDSNIPAIKPKEKHDSKKSRNGSSIDIVGFGLNITKQKTFELPTLKEEVGESVSLVENTSSYQSPLLVQSNIRASEIREPPSPKNNFSPPIHDISIDTIAENSYIFQKEDTIKEFQTLTDLETHSSSETCASKDVTLNSLSNCVVTPNGDPISSSYNYIPIFPTYFKPTPIPSESLNMPDLLFSNDVSAYSTSVMTPQNKHAECETLQTQAMLESSQPVKYNKRLQQVNVNNNKSEPFTMKLRSGNTTSNQYRPSRRKSRRDKKVHEQFNVQQSSQQNHTNEIESSMQHLPVTYIPLKDHSTQNNSRILMPPTNVSYEQKPINKASISKIISKDTKPANTEQPSKTSRQQEQISTNSQRILRSDSFQHTSKHDTTKTPTIFYQLRPRENMLYRFKESVLQRPMESISQRFKESASQRSKESTSQPKKSSIKLSKANNTKNNIQVPEVLVTKIKQMPEMFNNKAIKPKTMWSMQCANAQSSKLAKRQVFSSKNEDVPVKKRKLAANFSSFLEADRDICSANQQEMQEKQVASMKKGMSTVIFNG